MYYHVLSVLSQIQRYDNFIIPVVDSLKYLTPIAYDVLAYCIIEALGNPQKERLKLEDTNLSIWLQILASFSANIFKKYPVDLTGLLQYVTNQLKAGKSFDLLVLKEVIQKMAGIEISDEITAAQLEAMAGGELLKVEGGYFSQVRNTKKSSQRLREALVDSNLCLPLCLLTAQQRDCIVYRDGSHLHLKLVCSMYDNCMDTLVQFGGFLSSHLSPDEYSKRVPSLDTLIQEYRMTGDVAFFLYRPKIFSSIGVKFAELEKSFKHFITSCEEVFGPIIESVRPLQPSKVWEDINCSFYVAFWSLSLYDLHVPKERYNDEINKAKDAIQALENNQEMPASKKKKEQERSQALIDKLMEEKKRQEDNHQLIISYLRNQKDSFINPRVLKSRTLNRLLQLCIFPRCRFTTLDAIYCAKFIQTLHILETPNFSTILLLDKLFSDVSCTVSACTENEVRRYGHFLYYLLEMIGRWHNSESIYMAECANTQGFVSTMKSSASGNEKLNLDYENYRHVTHKWHYKITKSLVMCLESKDYIQIRNGLLLLTKILPHYPKVEHLSLVLERRVGKIIEEEKDKRQDLYVLAIGYAGMLKTQAPNLIPETEFHEKVIKKEEPDTLSNGKDEKPKPKPAPSSSQTSDKPKPPEKPKVSTKAPKVPEKVKSSENKVPTLPATEKPSSTERTEKPKSVPKPSEPKTDKISTPKTGGGGGSESKRTPSAERVSSTTTPTATANNNNNATAKTGAAADKVEPKSSSKVDHKSTDSKTKQSEEVKTSKPVKTEPVSSQTTPTSDAKNIKKDEVIQATATSTTEPKKGVVTTPTLESKKVPMLSLEKLPSGRVTRPTDSDSPRGQRRPHPTTTGGQSNSSETHDKDPKKRKVEETSTPAKAGHASSSPSTDKKVTTTTTVAAATPTGGEGGDKTSGKTSNNVSTPKPERKRERLPDKDPPSNS
ncbi:PREDICTED: THO complex subunit 2-like, partial [Amphimedon queenslandica]|uniref:THO complex subunit 2 n=1 Tax=Amphimedon queenslandica TaxID=400682 RepID=A0AAN0JU34_AMPQE